MFIILTIILLIVFSVLESRLTLYKYETYEDIGGFLEFYRKDFKISNAIKKEIPLTFFKKIDDMDKLGVHYLQIIMLIFYKSFTTVGLANLFLSYLVYGLMVYLRLSEEIWHVNIVIAVIGFFVYANRYLKYEKVLEYYKHFKGI